MKQTEHPYWHRLYRCLEDFGTRYQNIPDFFKDRIQRYGMEMAEDGYVFCIEDGKIQAVEVRIFS